MLRLFTIISISISSFFIGDKIHKKIIHDDEYNYEFFVTITEINAKLDKEYYWFKSGEIHHSKANTGGHTLHGSYLQYYKSNQLAVTGQFDYGLKDGTWNHYNENGQLQKIIHWSKGDKTGLNTDYDSLGIVRQKGRLINGMKYGNWEFWDTNKVLVEASNWANDMRHGYYKEYDTEKNLVLSGNYYKNKKDKRWINHTTKDTTYYNKGEKVSKEDYARGLIPFVKNIFRSELTDTEREQFKKQKQEARKQSKEERLLKKESKKNDH